MQNFDSVTQMFCLNVYILHDDEIDKLCSILSSYSRQARKFSDNFLLCWFLKVYKYITVENWWKRANLFVPAEFNNIFLRWTVIEIWSHKKHDFNESWMAVEFLEMVSVVFRWNYVCNRWNGIDSSYCLEMIWVSNCKKICW